MEVHYIPADSDETTRTYDYPAIFKPNIEGGFEYVEYGSFIVGYPANEPFAGKVSVFANMKQDYWEHEIAPKVTQDQIMGVLQRAFDAAQWDVTITNLKMNEGYYRRPENHNAFWYAEVVVNL